MDGGMFTCRLQFKAEHPAGDRTSVYLTSVIFTMLILVLLSRFRE